MMKLHDLFNTNLLQRMLDEKMIKPTWHPELPYIIYNYTEKAQFSKTWNEVTLNSRGLIVRTTDFEVLARPWPKFFNYGERGILDADPDCFELDEPFEVTDKMDGSLGILYRARYREGENRYEITTRGSFTSSQAPHAQWLWDLKYQGRFEPPAGWTMLFEIIYPENRIVVDYKGTDDLVYLGAVHIDSGLTMGPGWPSDWPGPRAEVLPATTLRQALLLDPRPGKEGLVLRSTTDDTMLKLKQSDYVQLHRIVTGLNTRTIWERCMRADLDLPEGVSRMNQVLEGIPDELHEWASEIAESLVDQFRIRLTQIYDDLRHLVDRGLYGDRKACAFKMRELDWRKWEQKGVWLAYDKNTRKLHEYVWKLVRPEEEREPNNG